MKPYDTVVGEITPKSKQPSILHVDMDAFFASVEQRDNPELRGKPVLVGGSGPRGVVCAASYEARPFGCRSAQPMSVALRNCPHAIVVKPNGSKYRDASKIAFDVLQSFTPIVEPLSIDEAFLDVTGSQRRFGPAEQIAKDIRSMIRERTQLTCSIGVAPNKFLAKLSSEMNKPDGLTIVPIDRIPQWLAPQPIRTMWGVGPAAEKRLRDLGVQTFGDVQQIPLVVLENALGTWGMRLYHLSFGRDTRDVMPDHSRRTVSQERTFSHDLDDPEQVLIWLMQQTEQVAARLRRSDLHAKTVTIKIRFGNFETVTRSRSLGQPTNRTDALLAAAKSMFEMWTEKSFRPVRLIGMGAIVADTPAQQLSLFEHSENDRGPKIDALTDTIRSKFGDSAIVRGRILSSEHRRSN